MFTWTPDYGQAGDTPCTSWPPTPSARPPRLDVVVHVAHVVRPPVLNTPNHQATLGVPLSFPIVATDLDAGTTLSYSALNLPAGASIDPTTGQFPWTPGPSQAGDYVVTLQVSDGQATSTQNILIRAAVQPQLPGVTIVLTPSFPAIPGQQVMINAIAGSVAPITSLTRHAQRPAADPRRQRPGHDHRRRARPDAHRGDRDRPGRPRRHGDRHAQGARPERHGRAGRLLRQLGARTPCSPRPTAILGTVSDSNLDSWTLRDRHARTTRTSPCWRPARRPVNDGALAQLDPGQPDQRLLPASPDGARHQRPDRAGPDRRSRSTPPTKPNDNVVTDADLSVNLDGTTILIQRTYDPLTRDGTGDFGYGWVLVNRRDEPPDQPADDRPGRPAASTTRSATAPRST